jgi:hypothetical protein
LPLFHAFRRVASVTEFSISSPSLLEGAGTLRLREREPSSGGACGAGSRLAFPKPMAGGRRVPTVTFLSIPRSPSLWPGCSCLADAYAIARPSGAFSSAPEICASSRQQAANFAEEMANGGDGA